MNFYQFIIPRLEGADIDSKLNYYLSLVKKGVAGFIIFGGEIESLRVGIKRLQDAASIPLIISSDLEQGLGQQVKGGTTFPPATAMAHADRNSPGIARRAFACIASEAAFVGINTIFAPVLDVNSNPANPIISTRAFSGDPDEVSSLGRTMIETFMEYGIVPCGKHFPGHGDTSVDSHLAIAEVNKTMAELEACELKPFREAVSVNVPMIMVGHLKVPALDPSGMPATISTPTIRFLRDSIGFNGLVITDAMNMGGLGAFSAVDGALMALDAGVDILLHPSDPDSLASALERSSREFDAERLIDFRKSLPHTPSSRQRPSLCEDLSLEATRYSIVADGSPVSLVRPFVLVLSDEGADTETPFVDALRRRYPDIGHATISTSPTDINSLIPEESDLITVVCSKVKAFKGGTPPWVEETLRGLSGRVRVAVSFGNPHALSALESDIFRIFAWWNSGAAQLQAANKLLI